MQSFYFYGSSKLGFVRQIRGLLDVQIHKVHSSDAKSWLAHSKRNFRIILFTHSANFAVLLQHQSSGTSVFRSSKWLSAPVLAKSFSVETENTDVVKSTAFLPAATRRHPVTSQAFTQLHFVFRKYSLQLCCGFQSRPFGVDLAFFPLSVWVLSRFSRFLLHSKIMTVGWIGSTGLRMFVLVHLYVARQ